MLILLGKVLVGAIPGMTQDLSWTVTNLGYMAVCLLFMPPMTMLMTGIFLNVPPRNGCTIRASVSFVVLC